MIRVRGILIIIMTVIITAATGVAAWAAAHTGTVVESITGGGYTYMNITEGKKNFWIAGPRSAVPKGAVVSFDEQVWMINFKSKALGRTFPQLLFVSGVQTAKNGAVAAPGPAASKTARLANIRSIEDIISNKSALKGKPVSVRGNVVKVSNNIMGHSWVHMEDGTADGERLVFRSTTGTAEVGDVITATGRLETDVDFGFGYFYPVIVENASFEK